MAKTKPKGKGRKPQAAPARRKESPRRPDKATLKKEVPTAVPPPQEDWREVFLRALRASPNVSAAAIAAQRNRQYVYTVRKEEPDFKAAWKDAIAQSVDMLEGEMYRRAVEGTLKPVYQNGMLVGSIREYSDTLAIFLAKAHRPKKYRDNYRIEHTGKDGGPIEHTDVKRSLIGKFTQAIADVSSHRVPGEPDAG